MIVRRIWIVFMKRLGNQTLELEKDCYIIGSASFVGEKEMCLLSV